jgi:hypothetical protein
VLLTYVFETGLVGALVVTWVGYFLFRVWVSSRYDLTFAAVGALWLIGVTLITSYEQLVPLWVTLGWLSVWPELCKPNGLPEGDLATRAASEAARGGGAGRAARAAGGVGV